MKKFVIPFSMLFVIVLAGGCFNKERQSTAESISTQRENVTLELWLAGNDQSLYTAYDAAVKTWLQTNPTVKININMYAWSEYFTKLSTAFVGGTAPDVFSLGFGQFYSVAKNNNLLPLNNYISKDWDGFRDIPQSILDLSTIDGQLQGILVPESRAIYYRKDIAEQQGVTEADLKIETLDDLIALAKKMTVKKGNEIIMEGFELATMAGNNPEQQTFIFGRMEGADIYWNRDLSGNFNNAAFVSGLKKAKTLLDGYAILQTPGINYFFTDTAAITISNQGAIEPQLAQLAELGGDVGIISLPKGSNLLLGQFYAVNKNVKQPQEAVDFLVYLNSVDGESILMDKMGQVPNRKSLTEQYCGNSEMRKTFYNSLMDGAAIYSDTPNPYFLTWINDFRTAVESIYTDNADPQKAMNDFIPKYNSAVGSK